MFNKSKFLKRIRSNFWILNKYNTVINSKPIVVKHPTPIISASHGARGYVKGGGCTRITEEITK